jgi:hypothetical protein
MSLLYRRNDENLCVIFNLPQPTVIKITLSFLLKYFIPSFSSSIVRFKRTLKIKKTASYKEKSCTELNNYLSLYTEDELKNSIPMEVVLNLFSYTQSMPR